LQLQVNISQTAAPQAFVLLNDCYSRCRHHFPDPFGIFLPPFVAELTKKYLASLTVPA